jgi:hypothetical protein
MQGPSNTCIYHFPKQTIEIIMSSLEIFVMCLIQVFIVKAMQATHELLPRNTYVEGDQSSMWSLET